jgi:hypothetical protein
MAAGLVPGWSRFHSSHAFFPGSRLSNISHPLVSQGLTDCSQGLPPAPPGQEDLGNIPGHGHEIDLYRRQARDISVQPADAVSAPLAPGDVEGARGRVDAGHLHATSGEQAGPVRLRRVLARPLHESGIARPSRVPSAPRRGNRLTRGDRVLSATGRIPTRVAPMRDCLCRQMRSRRSCSRPSTVASGGCRLRQRVEWLGVQTSAARRTLLLEPP